MSTRSDQEFAEIESLIYRLFAEKQFAMALLALIMVANLMCAQFLLLRISTASVQAATAPAAQERVDVVCSGGQLQALDGSPLDTASLQGAQAVLHLDTAATSCVSELPAWGVTKVLFGVTMPKGDGP